MPTIRYYEPLSNVEYAGLTNVEYYGLLNKPIQLGDIGYEAFFANANVDIVVLATPDIEIGESLAEWIIIALPDWSLGFSPDYWEF